MRVPEASEQQLDFEAFAAFAAPEPPTPTATRPSPGPPVSGAKADLNVYGDDFALVRVRDGFYADERRVFYVSRGRVYLVRSPRMRAGQGFRRIAELPAEVHGVDEASFNPDDADDFALFAVADCIDGIE